MVTGYSDTAFMQYHIDIKKCCCLWLVAGGVATSWGGEKQITGFVDSNYELVVQLTTISATQYWALD